MDELPVNTKKQNNGTNEVVGSRIIQKPVSKRYFYLIGIGASAGGFEAIREFFEFLPTNMDASYVIVQHLSPNVRSLMEELLKRYTDLPIITVENDVLIEPRKVYLISNRKNLEAKGAYLRVLGKNLDKGPNKPIDVFFTSLANEWGKMAIGIILSGTGTDGSRGIIDIKANDGKLFVQSPKLAKFNGMPNAALQVRGIVEPNNILPVKKMAHEIVKLIQGNFFRDEENLNKHGAGTKEVFARIIKKLSDVVGVNFSLYRTQTLFRRLVKQMRMTNCKSLIEFEKLLEHNQANYIDLFNEFLIGVTHFFRDREVFRLIESQLIPELFKKIESSKQVRLWVVGCSTGEEAYSYGMLLSEYLEKINFKADFKIFATDLSKESIEFAGKGIFPSSKISNLYPDLRSKYFDPISGKRYQVKKELREKIVFAVHNLLQDPSFINVDVVSCRNLMIYFKSDVQRKMLLNFQFALNNKGYLILGNSETVGDLKNTFKRVFSKSNIFQCVLDKNIISNKRFEAQNDPSGNIIANGLTLKSKQNLSGTLHGSKINQFSTLLLNEHVPLCVFINERFDVLYAHGKIEQLFGFPQRGAKLNILEMVAEEEGLIFRNGARKVIKSKKSANYKGISFSKGSQIFVLDLRFKSFDVENENHKVVLIEFFIKNLTDKKVVESEVTEENYMSERVRTLEAELKEAREEMQSLIVKLESSNDELQDSNEQLKSSNEELQSTNEELHSVNEELFTVNTELQEKIADLTQLNNDVDNLLNSTEIGTIFLDTNLTIRKFTPSVVPIFNLQNGDAGRPIQHFKSELDYKDLVADSKSVINTGEIISKELKCLKSGCYFLMRILPYKTYDDNTEGVVLTFVNITDQKLIENKLRESKDLFLNVIDNMSEGLLVADDQGNWVHYNKRAEEIAGVGPVDNAIDKWSDVYGVFHTDKVTPVKTEELPLFKAVSKGISTENAQYFVRNKDRPEGIYILGGGRPVKFFKNGTWVNGGVSVFRDITEVKKAQEAAQWNELRYRHLAETTFDVVWSVDGKGKIISPQTNWEEYTGYSWEEYKGWKWIQYIHEEDRERMLTDWKWALKNKKVYESEGRIYLKSFKDYRYFRNKAVPLLDKNNNILEWIGICADATEQVLAQRKLRDSEERYQLVIEGIQAGVFDWRDLNSDETWWSPKFYKLLGYKPGEIRPSIKTFFEKLHPADKIRTQKVIEGAIEKGEMPNMEYRLKVKTGKYKWFLASSAASYDVNGKVTRLAGCITDIDKSKKAQDKLKESEERFRSMSDAAPMFIWVADRKKRFKFFNKTWLDFRAKKIEGEILEWKFGIHEDDRDEYNKVFNDAYRKKAPFSFEYRLKRKDGEYRWILDTGKPHFGNDDKFLGFVGSGLDVTERKNAEENLKRSNRELEQFAYVTTHDLRAPTVNLRSLIKIFIKKGYVNELNERWFTQAQTAVEDIHDTLHDLISVVAFKKTLNERIERVSFNEVFNKVMEGFNELLENNGGSVESDFTEVDNINYITGHLKSILSNLISNAIKYRDKKRPVKVKVFTESFNSFICLNIRDNGSGIPPRQREKIFMLFQRLTEEKEGKGIGLFITKSQVEAMGGKIELESEVGIGSTFKIYLRNDLNVN